MNRHIHIHDPRRLWAGAIAQTAANRGWSCSLVKPTNPMDGGYGFVRTHAHPEKLRDDQRTASEMALRLRMIQDAAQVAVYDNKRAQIARWARWMPETHVFDSFDRALAWADKADYPIVSKADVGASSVNVRLLRDFAAAEAHLTAVFAEGVEVSHCSMPHPAKSLQQGYVILQPFIPHEITYRVNAVGNDRAVFFRRCFDDENKPFAQTGNVEPAYGMTDEIEPLIAWADEVFEDIGSKWCALDVLETPNGYRLLETSLAWPWPSPGDCNNGRFLRGGRKWVEMFDVMFDELEAGTWH